MNALAVLEFFRDALHLAVDRDEQTVDGIRIQRAIGVGNGVDDARTAAISSGEKVLNGGSLGDGLAAQRRRVKRNDMVRYFGQGAVRLDHRA